MAVTQILVRDLPPEVVERLDAAARAAGTSRNAYVVRLLTENAPAPRPRATAEGLRRLTELAADLGDEELMRRAWS